MANDVFSLADDVEVSLYTWPSTVFIWNVTRWDNGDQWAADGSFTPTQDWQTITGSVASITIDNGITLEQALTRPEPATASVVFQNTQYDPFNNEQIKTGTPIRIRVRPNPDTAPTTWVTLYQGKIDNASASYNDNFVNTVTLTCVTDLRDYLNFTSADGLTTAASCFAHDYIDVMNGKLLTTNAIIYNVLYDGFTLEGIDTLDPVPFGDLVNQLLDANLGALVYKPITVDPAAYVYMTSEEIGSIDTQTSQVDFEAETSANTLRASFYDITVGFNTEEIVNSINYSTTLGYGPNNLKNDNSIALYGDLGLEITTLHWNDVDADTWANQITLSEPTRRVQNIQAPMLLRAGQINANLLRDPMDIANIYVNNANIYVSENYFITRIQHDITPDNWVASLDLWKGR